MRLKLIACEVVKMEVEKLLPDVGHEIECDFRPIGLHDEPDKLRADLQEAVAGTEDGFDYLLLGYGICSTGLAQIRAGSIPLVIPRAHDCITFFLGSHRRYLAEFTGHPGTYYFTCGWIERKEAYPEESLLKSRQEAARRARFEEYVAKYGEDNARYLIEVESTWMQHYDRAAFINEGIGDLEAYRRFTRQVAEDHDWQYVEIEGSDRLLRALLAGPWPEEEFLIVPPGGQIVERYDGSIIGVDGP